MEKIKEKTNAIRALEQKKILFTFHEYPSDVALSGVEVAELIGQPLQKVYKTLVTVGKSNTHYVFVVPAAAELDLKKAAKAAGEKSVEMVKSKDLLPLTGYVHGGCSPVGMKKFFKTTFDESAQNVDRIFFSGGRIGFQIETTLSELKKAITFQVKDITVKQ